MLGLKITGLEPKFTVLKTRNQNSSDDPKQQKPAARPPLDFGGGGNVVLNVFYTCPKISVGKPRLLLKIKNTVPFETNNLNFQG